MFKKLSFLAVLFALTTFSSTEAASMSSFLKSIERFADARRVIDSDELYKRAEDFAKSRLEKYEATGCESIMGDFNALAAEVAEWGKCEDDNPAFSMAEIMEQFAGEFHNSCAKQVHEFRKTVRNVRSSQCDPNDLYEPQHSKYIDLFEYYRYRNFFRINYNRFSQKQQCTDADMRSITFRNQSVYCNEDAFPSRLRRYIQDRSRAFGYGCALAAQSEERRVRGACKSRHSSE